MTDDNEHDAQNDPRKDPQEDEAAAEAKEKPVEPADGPSSEAAVGEEAAPAKKIRTAKTKKKKSPTVELEDDSPDGKTLKEAQVAFEVGDYKVARELAQKLVSSSRAPVADAARDILRRTDVDPAQMIFLAACACAIIGVAFYYLR